MVKDINLYESISNLPQPEDCLMHLMNYQIRDRFLCELIEEEAFARDLYGDVCPYIGIPRDFHPKSFYVVTNCGLRIRANYFLVANNHPILEDIYADTPWENSLWSHSLLQLEGAQRHAGCHYYLPNGKQTHQRGVKIPRKYASHYSSGD